MTIFKTSFAGIAIAAAGLLAMPAAATTFMDVTGDSTWASIPAIGSGGAGVYGLEVRGGRDGRADWEIGIGQGTSRPSNFNQAEFSWPSDFTLQSFSYDYGVTTANTATVTIGNVTQSYVFADGLLTGNAFEIFAKRDAQLIVTEVDGMAVNYVVGDASSNWDVTEDSSVLRLGSLSLLDGFNVEGQIAVRGGGGSRHGVNIKAGNVSPDSLAPIPLPAGLPLLAAALGGLAILRRKTA